MINWLVCLADECPSIGADRPPGFLSEPERETLARLTFAKRRHEWLLGRWTAKHLLQLSQAAYRSLPMNAITVGNDPDGAPYLSVNGKGRLPVCVSISHRDDRAFCALSPTCPSSIGADIERVEPRDPAFVCDFFTSDEAERIWACPLSRRDTLVTVMWSAKEAALKALRHGLRVDTRRVEIHHVAGIEPDQTGDWACTWPVPEAWHEVKIDCALARAAPFSVWWRPQEDYVLTLAVLAPTSTPLAYDPRDGIV